MLYSAQFSYFDQKGNQHSAVIDRSSLKALIAAMSKILEKNELYHITHVSPNLVSYDFKQHGDHFHGWK